MFASIEYSTYVDQGVGCPVIHQHQRAQPFDRYFQGRPVAVPLGLPSALRDGLRSFYGKLLPHAVAQVVYGRQSRGG